MKKFLLILALWSFAAAPEVRAADDFGTLIFNHEIALGMSYGNVVAAWGKPDKVDRSVSNSGTTEYWFYRTKKWMVVFENGRVRSFSQY